MKRDDDQPRVRQILAANLDRLKRTAPEYSSAKKIADASGGALTNGTVGRIMAASHTTDLDKLEALARLFQLQPWQLLVDDLDPERPPLLVNADLVEQIKAVVTAELIRKDDAQDEKESTDARPVTKSNTNGGISESIVGSSLHSAIKVVHKPGSGSAGTTTGRKKGKSG